MRICIVLGPHAALQANPERLNYARSAVLALSAAGHELHVLGDASTIAAGFDGPAGVSLHEADPVGDAAAAYPRPAYAHAMGVRTALARLHAEHAFDAVEFSTGLGEGYFAVRTKRATGAFAGVVLVARAWIPDSTRRSGRLDERLGFEEAVLDHAQLAVIREADAVLSPTQALLDVLAPSIERASVWGPPVRHAVGTPMPGSRKPTNPKAGPKPEPFKRLVFTGPLEHARGCLHLAQAAALIGTGLPGLAFLGPDVGAGPFGRPMRPLIERALGTAASAEFSDDSSPRDDDLACLPTRADAPDEAQLTAALAGRAPLVGDAAGMKESLGPAACLASDPLVFAAELSALLADPERVATIRRGARDHASAFTDPGAFAVAFERAVVDAAERAASVPTPIKADAPSGITAIVPVFNLGRFLPETIAAIRAQTLPPEHILIVDDGSTDQHTRDVLAEIESQGLTVLRKPNGGVGSARNLGVRTAATPLVAAIDADDLPEPDFFARAAALLRSTPTLSYASTLPLMFETDAAQGRPGWIPLGLPGFDEDLLLCRNCGGLGGCTVFVREHLLDAGGYDETLPSYEDWDLWCRLAGRGRAGIVIPEFLARYRVHPGSKHATVGRPIHDRLKSAIIARHARPPLLTERTLRFEAAESTGVRDAIDEAREAQARAGELARQIEASAEWARTLQARADELARQIEASAEWARTLQARGDKLDEELARSATWNRELQTRANDLGLKLQEAATWGQALDQRVTELATELGRSADWNRELQSMVEARDAELGTARLVHGRLTRTTDENVYLAQQLSAARDQRQAAEEQLHQARARAEQAERTLASIDRVADAQAVVRAHIRYRAADVVNDALKRLHVQRAIKAVVGSGGGGGGKKDDPAHSPESVNASPHRPPA